MQWLIHEGGVPDVSTDGLDVSGGRGGGGGG